MRFSIIAAALASVVIAHGGEPEGKSKSAPNAPPSMAGMDMGPAPPGAGAPDSFGLGPAPPGFSGPPSSLSGPPPYGPADSLSLGGPAGPPPGADGPPSPKKEGKKPKKNYAPISQIGDGQIQAPTGVPPPPAPPAPSSVVVTSSAVVAQTKTKSAEAGPSSAPAPKSPKGSSPAGPKSSAPAVQTGAAVAAYKSGAGLSFAAAFAAMLL